MVCLTKIVSSVVMQEVVQTLDFLQSSRLGRRWRSATPAASTTLLNCLSGSLSRYGLPPNVSEPAPTACPSAQLQNNPRSAMTYKNISQGCTKSIESGIHDRHYGHGVDAAHRRRARSPLRDDRRAVLAVLGAPRQYETAGNAGRALHLCAVLARKRRSRMSRRVRGSVRSCIKGDEAMAKDITSPARLHISTSTTTSSYTF